MKHILAVWTLLAGMLIMLAGVGLLGTLLGVRGEQEAFSVAAIGLIMSGYFLGFVIGPLIVPALIRRVGHVRVFATMATLVSAAALLHGLLLSPVFWFLLRVVAGISVVGIYVVIESWLHARIGNNLRGYLFSVYMTCTLTGLGLGQILLITGEVGGLQLFATASVLLSLGLVPVTLTRVREPKLLPKQRLGLRRLFAMTPLGLVGCLCAGLISGSFWGLGAVMAVSSGLEHDGVAWFMGSVVFGGVLLTTPVGRLSDRFERRGVLSWVSLGTGLAALLLWWLLQFGMPWLLAGAFVYGALNFNIYSLSAAHANDLAGYEHALETNAGLQLAWGIGASIGPVAGGFFMQQFGGQALLPFMAAAALIPALYGCWRVTRRAPLPVEQQAEYRPRFVTSPAAAELYPEQSETPESA